MAAVRTGLFALPRRMVRFGVENPYLTMGFWIVGSLLLAMTLPRLHLDTSTSTFLDQSDPAWQVYQQSLDNYGGDEFVVVALEAPSPFARETLEEVRDLTRIMEKLPGVRRVDSLSTVPMIRAGAEGELLLGAALEDGVPTDPAVFEQLLTDLRRDPIARDSLFSRDERLFAINVMLDDDAPRSSLQSNISSRGDRLAQPACRCFAPR